MYHSSKQGGLRSVSSILIMGVLLAALAGCTTSRADVPAPAVAIATLAATEEAAATGVPAPPVATPARLPTATDTPMPATATGLPTPTATTPALVPTATQTVPAASTSATKATAAPIPEGSTANTTTASACGGGGPPADLPDLEAVPRADVAASLTAANRDTLAERPQATLYRIAAALDVDRNLIVGLQNVRLTNTEETALDAVYFRLYANAPRYQEGGIIVEDLQVNGAPAQGTLEVEDTALKVGLPRPLQPGETAEIGLRFTTTVPNSSPAYGIFNVADCVFALYNWHPELAVYEKGGWLLDPAPKEGDLTNTDAANYEVMFAAPPAYTLATTGVEVEATPRGGQILHRYVAALARNFVLVAGDHFEHATQQAGEVTLSSYYLRGAETGGKAVLATAASAVELFDQRFGPYPYTELDVVEVNLGGGAGGMEATGLIMIGSALYDPAHTDPFAGLGAVLPGAEGANILAFTTAHEVAHQWWYGVVGSNALQQPWLDESLTNWSSAFYTDEAAGAEAGKLARDLFIDLPYRMTLMSGDQRLDQPVDSFDQQAYGTIVYGKGALMYAVLRKELGDDRFFAFLRRYYQEQRFDRADGGEWLQTLSQEAGKDMAPFYRKWVEGTSIGQSDLPAGGPLSGLFNGGLDLDRLLPAPGR